MSEICLHPDKLLGLLDEIGRHRALTDDETDIIEAIVCRGHKSTGVRFDWNPRLDIKLTIAGNTRGGVRRFAEHHLITPQAAYDRLHKLRKAKAAKAVGKG